MYTIRRCVEIFVGVLDEESGVGRLEKREAWGSVCPKQNGKSKHAHQADETKPKCWFFKAHKKRKGAENAPSKSDAEAVSQGLGKPVLRSAVDDGGSTCLAEAVV